MKIPLLGYWWKLNHYFHQTPTIISTVRTVKRFTLRRTHGGRRNRMNLDQNFDSLNCQNLSFVSVWRKILFSYLLLSGLCEPKTNKQTNKQNRYKQKQIVWGTVQNNAVHELVSKAGNGGVGIVGFNSSLDMQILLVMITWSKPSWTYTYFPALQTRAAGWFFARGARLKTESKTRERRALDSYAILLRYSCATLNRWEKKKTGSVWQARLFKPIPRWFQPDIAGVS